MFAHGTDSSKRQLGGHRFNQKEGLKDQIWLTPRWSPISSLIISWEIGSESELSTEDFSQPPVLSGDTSRGKKQHSNSFPWCQSSFKHLGESGLRMSTLLAAWVELKSCLWDKLTGDLLKCVIFIYWAHLNKIKLNGTFFIKSVQEKQFCQRESNNSEVKW